MHCRVDTGTIARSGIRHSSWASFKSSLPGIPAPQGPRAAANPSRRVQSAARFGTPEANTPKHLAEEILIPKSVLEGERKLVTVLFAERDVEELETPLQVFELIGAGSVQSGGHWRHDCAERNKIPATAQQLPVREHIP